MNKLDQEIHDIANRPPEEAKDINRTVDEILKNTSLYQGMKIKYRWRSGEKDE